MRVRVLGCSGGIGGRHLRTTSLLVDHDILIDAGTGLPDLPLAELAAIDHVFITHSHLDHIAALPLMVDSVEDLRERPLTIHATAATLETIRSHAGALLDQRSYEATAAIQLQPPASDTDIMTNPGGVYISALAASKIITNERN